MKITFFRTMFSLLALLAASPSVSVAQQTIHWQQGSTIKIPDYLRYLLDTAPADRIIGRNAQMPAGTAGTKGAYNGQWFCKIDGRNADMIVTTEVFLRNASCSDPARFKGCTWKSEESYLIIQFKDRGHGNNTAAPWVTMQFTKKKYHQGLSNRYILEMKHPDGNTWELHPDASRGVAGYLDQLNIKGSASDFLMLLSNVKGNTVWNGKEYPLSCTRVWPKT